MGFLGYEKNEIREYNDKRCCGLWFIIIGIVIIISAIWGGEKKLHPIIFTVGFIVGFYISAINRKVVSKLSWGRSSKFQNKIAIFSIAYFISAYVYFSRTIFPDTKLENDLADDFSCCWTSFYSILFCSGYIHDRNCSIMFCECYHRNIVSDNSIHCFSLC